MDKDAVLKNKRENLVFKDVYNEDICRKGEMTFILICYMHSTLNVFFVFCHHFMFAAETTVYYYFTQMRKENNCTC